ncbi:hypothetical protein IAD21_00203 [Abditibacteriota bacterium]|nr:hypothetical protein IAD21_00203 [Abditibacteriota bacterium]
MEQLGNADKVYELEGSKRLQYFDLQIEVSLEHERANRFGWVEVKNSKLLFFPSANGGLGRDASNLRLHSLLQFGANTGDGTQQLKPALGGQRVQVVGSTPFGSRN